MPTDSISINGELQLQLLRKKMLQLNSPVSFSLLSSVIQNLLSFTHSVGQYYFGHSNCEAFVHPYFNRFAQNVIIFSSDGWKWRQCKILNTVHHFHPPLKSLKEIISFEWQPRDNFHFQGCSQVDGSEQLENGIPSFGAKSFSSYCFSVHHHATSYIVHKMRTKSKKTHLIVSIWFFLLRVFIWIYFIFKASTLPTTATSFNRTLTTSNESC